ncbi:heat shock 70 kDa protein 14-like [Diadema antillarum]
MAASIGVYFGGTTSCVAINKDEKTEVLANDAGDRTTPNVVAFSDNDKVVGLAAKQGRLRNPVNTVMHVKHLLGRSFEDQVVLAVKKRSAFRVVDKQGLAGFEVELNNKKILISSLEVAVLIFKKLKEIAEHGGGKSVKSAVLTVPADFSGQQRDAVRKAAEVAGFDVLRLISEPSAAALAYSIGVTKLHDPCNVLVYRLGGSTVSVSVVNVTNGLYRIEASKTHHECGGDDITSALSNLCVQEFKRQYKMDVSENKRAMGKLYNACETCKHVLSTINTSHISVDSLYEGIDFHSNITRAKFESVVNVPLQRCLHLILATLQETGLSSSDIHKVIITGGSTRIPKLQSQLRDMFPDAELLNSISPEEVIATGAAVQAALLMSRDDSVSCSSNEIQTPSTSKSIYVKVVDESGSPSLHTIVPKLSYIPLRQQHYFTIPKEQDSLCLQLVEGEPGCAPAATTSLGQIVLRDLATEEPQEGKVTLDVHLKRDGSLEVTCSESLSGSMDSILVPLSSRPGDDQVKKE